MQSGSVSVHLIHLRFLVTEIYKSMTQINPKFMWLYFTYNNITNNLRKGPILFLSSTYSTYYGTNCVHFRASLIWNNLPRDIKSSKSVSSSHWRCSVKKVFLEISQNSQENTCARISFLIKLQVWGLKLY